MKANCITWSLAVWVISLGLMSPLFSFAQNQEIGLPFIQNYYPSEYKAHVQNFGVVQDTRGVMYFANFRGIVEFDGQTWRIIQTAKISQVTSLAIDTKGVIYAGGAGEIGYLQADNKGELQYKSLIDSLKEGDRHFQYVVNTLAASDGIYFVTDESILFWDGLIFKAFRSEGTINSVYYTDGKLYYELKGKGLYYLFNNQSIKILSGKDVSEAMDVKAIISPLPGKVIIATGSNGLLSLDGKGTAKFATEADPYLRQNTLSSGTMLRDGTLAFGTERGGLVLIFPDGRLKQIIRQGIQNDYIRALYVDKMDGLWLALDNGISRIEVPYYLSFFGSLEGIEGEVNQVIRNNAKLYFATSKGLYDFDEIQHRYSPVQGINSACWSVISDRNSIIAATSKGVYSIQGKQTELLTPGFSFRLLGSQVNPLNIYVGQVDGITLLKNVNGKWISKGKITGVTDEVSEIQEDPSGILWAVIATRGIVRINPEGREMPKIYDDTKGLPSRFGNHINKVRNTILVTTQNGIFSYDGKSDVFSQIKSLGSDTIITKEWHSLLVEDPKGNLWSNSGDETQIRYGNAGKHIQTQLLLMPIQERTIGTIYPESDGKVWFGGTEGAIRFDPGIQKNFSDVPKALIRSVSVRGDSVLFGGTFIDEGHHTTHLQTPDLVPNLAYSFNTLTFNFACPSFNINEVILFQYILKGFDVDSSAWNKEIQKEYTNLPPGKYEFSVRARNIYGIVSDAATFQFSINKPYYQTILAYFFYLAILGVFLYFVVLLRSRQLIKEKKKLESLILERTAEVVSQKEEIEKQSVELNNKNIELEKINLIVKSINSEIHFTSLLQSLLEKTKVIGGVQKATMLVREKSANTFSFKAGFGWDVSSVSPDRLSMTEIEEYYLQHTTEVYEDIFEIRKLKGELGIEVLDRMIKPQSVVIMIVRVNEQVEGFLILENVHKKQAFNQLDFSLLYNLKEHIISAFIKTIILEDLQTTLINLKETQEQLIQQEKLASIGQLTKGIVDRILNPLNYINNFSLLTNNLAREIEEIVESLHGKIVENTYEDITDLLKMVKANVLKVNEHGSSASRIVKGMEKLLKERSTIFVQTDINALVENHIEIALQQYMAENKDFKVNIIKVFDSPSEKISVLPAELGSVIVNTFENACYAVDEKAKKLEGFNPEITVSTQYLSQEVKIIIRDNGHGIPANEQKKLFSPFFTTKPTSKGTGLGLFMNMDIVKTHKGTIEVESLAGEFTAFIFKLPKTGDIKL